MKKYLFTLIAFSAGLLSSCDQDGEFETHAMYEAEIMEYLNEYKSVVVDEQIENIEEFALAINFKSVKFYELKTTEGLAIADMTTITGFNKDVNMKAVFFVNQGEIVRSNIATFEGQTSKQFDELLLSILNGELPKSKYTGKISLFNLYKQLSIFNSFENGILTAVGYARKQNISKTNGKTNNCTDWYLVTYYGNGNVTKEYVFTTCDSGCSFYRVGRTNCGGGGGSGGVGSGGGAELPVNPADGTIYEYTDKNGQYTKYKFDASINTWRIVEVILPPAVVEAKSDEYPFLDIDWPGAYHGQVVFGTDKIIYTFGSDGSWHGVESTVVISPDKPIANMADYLKCFNSNQNAQVTIYVNQPVPNSSAAHSGSVVGHTFVSISQNGNASVFGFYPKTDDIYPIINPSDPSAMGDDSSTQFDVSITTTVSGSVLQQIINYSVSYQSTYDLNSYNCSDFGIAVGNLAGLSLPEANGTWPGGGGSNPGALGQHIRNKSTSGSTTKNTSGGVSPSNIKNCN